MFRTNKLSIGGERNEHRWRSLRSVVGAAVITVGLAGATLAGNGWGDGNGNQAALGSQLGHFSCSVLRIRRADPTKSGARVLDDEIRDRQY